MQKISVALCTYNGERFLVEQLDSIFNQTLPVDEVVICDDLSTDATLRILETYQKQHSEIIRYYNSSVKHFTIKNFERAIALTTGDYVFLSDQDDIWLHNKVETTINYFKAHQDCVMLFTDASLIDEDSKSLDGSLWEKWGFSTALQGKWVSSNYQIMSLIQNNNKVTGATLCFKAKLKDDILPMNLPKGIWHDCYMALHAAKYEGLHFLDEQLIKYRVHDKQQVGLGVDAIPQNRNMISYKQYRQVLKRDFETYLQYYDSKYLRFDKTTTKENVLKLGLRFLLKTIKK